MSHLNRVGVSGVATTAMTLCLLETLFGSPDRQIFPVIRYKYIRVFKVVNGRFGVRGIS